MDIVIRLLFVCIIVCIYAFLNIGVCDEKNAIENAAKAEGISKALLSAICYVESGHQASARRPDDGKNKQTSHGLCQIQLGTAKLVGFIGHEEDLYNPYVNAIYAAKYLAQQLRRYNDDWVAAIAAYNAGSYRVNWQGFPINWDYVSKVFTALSEGR